MKSLEHNCPDIRVATKISNKPNATVLAKSLKDYCDVNAFDASDPSSQPLLSLTSKPLPPFEQVPTSKKSVSLPHKKPIGAPKH